MRLLSSLTVGAAIAGWLTVTAATAPQPDPAPAPAFTAVQAQAVDHIGCWVEKVHLGTRSEVICGDTGDRPATDTADIGQPFGGNAAGDGGWYWEFVDGFGFDLVPVGWN